MNFFAPFFRGLFYVALYIAIYNVYKLYIIIYNKRQISQKVLRNLYLDGFSAETGYRDYM